MRRGELYPALCEILQDGLGEVNNAHFYFDSNHMEMSETLYDPATKEIDIVLHVKDLFSTNKLKANAPLAENAVAEAVFSAFKELRRAHQFQNYYAKEWKHSTLYAYDHIVSTFNPEWYKSTIQQNPRELDALIAAFEASHDYLGYIYGDEKANELLTAIANREYGANCNNLAEALKQFNEESFKAIRYPRGLTYTDMSKNETMALVTSNGWEDIHEKIKNAPNAFDEMRMLAAVTLMEHPEYQDYFPCTKDMDLSMDAVFGRTPEITEIEDDYDHHYEDADYDHYYENADFEYKEGDFLSTAEKALTGDISAQDQPKSVEKKFIEAYNKKIKELINLRADYKEELSPAEAFDQTIAAAKTISAADKASRTAEQKALMRQRGDNGAR